MSIKVGFDHWAVYSKYHDWQLMSPFDPELFILDEDLWYTAKDGSRFKVPAGFLTDLGSIPVPLWPILPRDKWPSAFILHDYLCEQSWISRIDTDKLLHEALIYSGARRWEVWIIYIGVRIGAGIGKVKSWFLKWAM